MLFIEHSDFLTDPEPVIDKMIKFLNIDINKRKDMLAAIDKTMYRNKSK